MNEGTSYGTEVGAGSDMAELARLADELVEEIGAARRHYDDLRATLDGYGQSEGDEETYAEAPVAVALAERPVDDVEAETEPDDDAPPSVEGARLVALNLALMGIARDDARMKLCDGFEIEPRSVDEILDEAYGVHDQDEHADRPSRRRFRRGRNGRR